MIHNNKFNMPNPPIEKLPPQNIEAEKSLLGSLIIDREAINKVADFLKPEDFYHKAHQNIYKAIFSLFEKMEPIDLLSVSNKLQEMKVLDEIGGISYISSLATSVPTSAHIHSYAKIVQKKKKLRELIDAAHYIMDLGHREDDDIEELIDDAEKKIFSIASQTLTKNFIPLDKFVLNEAINRITSQHDEIRGCKTNFPELDETLGGLQKSDLIILAARPSVGKTAFALNIALNVAKQNMPVGIFSMEMSLDQIIDRFLSLESGVSLHHLRTGKLGEELQDVAGACEILRSLPIYVDDTPSPNILQMRAMARRLQAEKGLELLIVDYLQLMSSRKNYDSPVQQVTEISRGLKGLAKELNIPIIAISQLSRAVEQREGRKPRLSDLRDSGSIEQDADLVIFIHRDDKTDFEKAKRENKLNRAQVIIAKHRNGPTGEIAFYVDPASLRFRTEDKFHTDEYLMGEII
jgi:replicative DNA helicase